MSKRTTLEPTYAITFARADGTTVLRELLTANQAAGYLMALNDQGIKAQVSYPAKSTTNKSKGQK